MTKVGIAILLLITTTAVAQGHKRDPLSDLEIDKIRDAAQTPDVRLKLYVEFARARLDKLQQVNVKSVYWTTKFAFPALVASKGAILNTASMVGLLGQQDHAAYVATKGAMISLTKAMAADYARYQIRVNAVCPAGVWTPMLEQWCSDQRDPSSIRQYLNDIHLLGYCPHGDVIADAAVFLLSAKARFITGCILPVSGGAELGYRR